MKDLLITLAKGLWIGGTLTVPGVSGGAMAMILNIYDRLVLSLNSLFRRGKWQDKKKSLLFLVAAGVGGLVGFVVFSRLVGMLLDAFPVHVCFLFAGAIAGGIPAVLASADIKRLKVLDLVFVVLGAAVVSLVSLVPDGLFSVENASGIGGVAMLVAAISICNTMLMSIYERTREIGVMKVLGCKMSKIGAMFLTEAGIIGFGGGAMGLGISYVLSFVINTVIAANGAGDSFRSVIPPYLALGGVAFSVLVGVLAGLYPSQRAMRLSALAAIRNE